MFLSADQLAEITGRKSSAKQIEVLRQWGIPFRINALGRPVVLASAFENAPQEAEPDFSHVKIAHK